MARIVPRILAFGVAAGLLAGCGNKGALYMPDQPPPKKHKKTEPAPAQGTPAAKPTEAKPTDADKTTQGSGGTDRPQ